jgi:predicted DCC family thiol-disulfide oxidoreductase YuxK
MTLPAHIVFFDGHCGLCNRSVNLLIRLDKKKVLRYAPLQGSIAAEVLGSQAPESDTFLLLSKGRLFERSAAAIRAFSLIHPAARMVLILLAVPPFIRDAVYRAVSKVRYRIFGRSETCRMPRPGERELFLG